MKFLSPVNKVTITEPATGSTLTIANGATLSVSASATIGNGLHSGTNTGDQTSIVGIAGTKAQFDAACTDGNFAYISDLASYQPLDAALTALAAGSDFVQFLGPTATIKTFTLPDASSTLVVQGGALGTPSSGLLTNCTGTAPGLTAGNVTTNANLTGDVTSVGNASTLATVLGSPGTFGGSTKTAQITVNAKGLVTAISEGPSTPSIANVTGLGAGMGTFLQTPSSVNLIAAVTDETGTGSVVFSNSPTLVAPLLGTPASGVLTNCTGLTLGGLVNIAANSFVANNTGTSATPTALTAPQAKALLAISQADVIGLTSTSSPTFANVTLQNLSLSGNVTGSLGVYNYSVAVPSGTDAIELCSVTNPNFSTTVEIALTIHDAGYALSKRYLVPLQYDATANVWQKLLPITTSGPYAGNDAEVDVRVTGNITYFRIRRTAGATTGTAKIHVVVLGDPAGTTVATSSTTYSAPAAPTVNYAPCSLTQRNGFTGIANDNPLFALDVSGVLRVASGSSTALQAKYENTTATQPAGFSLLNGVWESVSDIGCVVRQCVFNSVDHEWSKGRCGCSNIDRHELKRHSCMRLHGLVRCQHDCGKCNHDIHQLLRFLFPRASRKYECHVHQQICDGC